LPGVTTVSVVIPSFNAAAWIEQAVRSVLDQEYEGIEVEIIVADDGSTDDTAAVVARFADRVRYLALSHCGRPGAVRNAGLAQARGEYIAFLDADDYWLPNSLAVRLRALRACGREAFAYANYMDQVEGELRLALPEALPSGDIFGHLMHENIMHTDTVLFPRALLERCSGFHPELRNAEDYFFWLQLARSLPAVYVPEPVSVYRHHPGGVSKIEVASKYPELIRSVQDYRARYGLAWDVYLQRVTPLRVRLATLNLRKGRIGEALRWWGTAFLTDPLRVIPASIRFLWRGAAA
jgi:glycosyltransferase involved in cell wall biosynthesis